MLQSFGTPSTFVLEIEGPLGSPLVSTTLGHPMDRDVMGVVDSTRGTSDDGREVLGRRSRRERGCHFLLPVSMKVRFRNKPCTYNDSSGRR